MTTPKGERRRQALIEAAAELMAEGGFDAVRHRAVAERAGVPLASTTYYFDSLDELIVAAAEHSARAELAAGRAALARLGGTAPDTATVVELVLTQLLGEPRAGDDFHAVLLRYERLLATGRRPYLRPLVRELGGELDALLADVLSSCGRPMSRAEVDRLVALVDGTMVNALLEVEPDPRGAARAALTAELARSDPPVDGCAGHGERNRLQAAQDSRTRGSSTA